MTTNVRHFRDSFRFKLLKVFTTVTILVAAVLVVLFMVYEAKSFKSRLTDRAQLLANLVASSVRIPLYADDPIGLKQKDDVLLDTPQVARAVITGINKNLLTEIRSSNIPQDSQIVSATSQVTTVSSTPSSNTALSGLPPQKPISLGSVTVDISLGNLNSSIISMLALPSFLALLFCIVVISICYPILKRVTRSFESLGAGLDAMTTGNFSFKIPVDNHDEAGRTALAINRLGEAIVEREAENKKLQEDLVNALRFEMSQEKQMVMAKLIQTNRMTSLGLLVSSMAHNINTPNGAVKLSGHRLSLCWKDVVPLLERVAEEEGDFKMGGLPFSVAREEVGILADSIVHNSGRIERTIQDLRGYSLGAGSEFVPNVSINKVVEGALSVIRAHGKHSDIPITQRLATKLPLIDGNSFQLEQVVVNLLLNAILASTSDGCVVTISTAFDQITGEVQIIVQDDGEGFPEEMMKSLCEPFVSTRLDKGGSGLGLYISNFIVTEHKGRLSFIAGIDRGTTVTVSLPTIQADC